MLILGIDGLSLILSYPTLITYCQPVCYFLKNTTIPCKEYSQYPVNTTYNKLPTYWKGELCKARLSTSLIRPAGLYQNFFINNPL